MAVWAVLALLLGVAATAPARADPPMPPAGAVVLRDAEPTVDAQQRAQVWIDSEGTATIADVAGDGRARFRPPVADTIYRLGPSAALWLHLRVDREREGRQDWVLEVPMPVVDLVTVYQGMDGDWRAESAGDTLAVSAWPEGGRYPFFRLDVPPGASRDVFLRIRHTTAADFPLRLSTVAAHGRRLQVEYLALGTAFGALLLLVAACLAQAWVYRDRIFAWYALYATITALAVAAFTGAGAHLLWPRFGALADAPMPMLASAAGAAAVLFVRNLVGLRRRFPVQDRLMLVLGLFGVLIALLPPFMPKSITMPAVGGYLAVATLAAVCVGLAAWLRGDEVGKWVFAAYLPMAASVMVSFLRIFGWVSVSFGSQYAVVAAMTIEVPLLLVALTIRSRDRHGAEIREQALTSHDALTGLLAPHLFQDRLRLVVTRHQRSGESAAVMFIDLVNYGPIKETFGTAVAEQSLLRSVIKLRRLLRDVDTVARMGEARFGVVLEGATLRSSVTERGARLIAAGLMPLPGLKPEVTLQFHVAALLLNERSLEADQIEAVLSEQLARMSPRTRRPIRFIAPEAPSHSDPGPQSSMFPPDAARSRPPLTAVN
ncbi:MAG: sensor domain-containing diguanylate cyclase [Ramlibacter sp.]